MSQDKEKKLKKLRPLKIILLHPTPGMFPKQINCTRYQYTHRDYHPGCISHGYLTSRNRLHRSSKTKYPFPGKPNIRHPPQHDERSQETDNTDTPGNPHAQRFAEILTQGQYYNNEKHDKSKLPERRNPRQGSRLSNPIPR